MLTQVGKARFTTGKFCFTVMAYFKHFVPMFWYGPGAAKESRKEYISKKNRTNFGVEDPIHVSALNVPLEKRV